MHFDYKFDDSTIHHGSSFAAARSAVMLKLVGKQGRSRPAMYTDLVNLWRHRLVTLRQHDWTALRDREEPDDVLRLQYMSNCPPFGVRHTVNARPCNRVRICPHCFAREIVHANYLSLRFSLAIVEAARTYGMFDVPDLKFVVIRRSQRLLTDAATDWPGTVKATVSGEKSLLALNFAGAAVFGSLTLVNIEPGAAGHIRLTRSAALLLPAAAAVPEDITTEQTRSRAYSSAFDAAAIDKYTGWCFQYPVGMMRGDPAVAVQLLQALGEGRSRLQSSTGLFNNAAMRNMFKPRKAVQSVAAVADL